VLNALVSSEQIRFKQTSETFRNEGRVPDEIRERVPDCGASDWKGTATVSVETVARLTVVLAIVKLDSKGDYY